MLSEADALKWVIEESIEVDVVFEEVRTLTGVLAATGGLGDQYKELFGSIGRLQAALTVLFGACTVHSNTQDE